MMGRKRGNLFPLFFCCATAGWQIRFGCRCTLPDAANIEDLACAEEEANGKKERVSLANRHLILGTAQFARRRRRKKEKKERVQGVKVAGSRRDSTIRTGTGV